MDGQLSFAKGANGGENMVFLENDVEIIGYLYAKSKSGPFPHTIYIYRNEIDHMCTFKS